MNRFIMANSQQCIGCRACEVACVMAHNGEQHALSERHFHPRITVLRSGEKSHPVTCIIAKMHPARKAARTAPSANAMTAYR